MAFVQYKVTTAGNVGASLASPSLTMTTGNLIVVVAQIANGGGNTVTGVSDGGVNTYQLATGSRGTGGSGTVFNSEIWFAMNVTGGTRAVTVTWGVGSSGGFTQVQVGEYSGMATTLALDVATFTGPSSNTSTTLGVTLTTLYWNDLIIAACHFTGSGTTWAGWGAGTPADRTTLGGLGWGDFATSTPQVFASPNPSQVNTTATGSGAFVMSVAAFKFPSGATQYEALNAGASVQLPVIGSVPGAGDASVALLSPSIVSTPVLGEIPSLISFTSPTGPQSTISTNEMPFGYFLVGNMFNGGYAGMPWTINAWMLSRPYLDPSITWPRSGQEN